MIIPNKFNFNFVFVVYYNILPLCLSLFASVFILKNKTFIYLIHNINLSNNKIYHNEVI